MTYDWYDSYDILWTCATHAGQQPTGVISRCCNPKVTCEHMPKLLTLPCSLRRCCCNFKTEVQNPAEAVCLDRVQEPESTSKTWTRWHHDLHAPSGSILCGLLSGLLYENINIILNYIVLQNILRRKATRVAAEFHVSMLCSIPACHGFGMVWSGQYESEGLGVFLSP